MTGTPAVPGPHTDLLARADYRLDNAPDSVSAEESVDLDLITDLAAALRDTLDRADRAETRVAELEAALLAIRALYREDVR